ncbi:MAG: hypothetical protein ACPLPT_10260 [Moorellales bacterium]
MHWAVWLLMGYLTAIVLGLLVFVVNSFQEREPRAVRVGLFLLSSTMVLALVIIFQGNGISEGLLPLVYLVDVLATLLLLLMVLPFGRNPEAKKGTMSYIEGEVKRFDERDTIFARIRSLRPGTREYEEYYAIHPDIKEGDDERRSLGGLLGVPGYIDRHNQVNLAMLHALNSFPQLLGKDEVVTPQPKGQPLEIDPKELSKRVKGFARHLGADLVGIAKLNPLWIYSHQGEIFYGNWEDWGKENRLDHSFAVVIATEMDRGMVMTRPHTPATIESMANYCKGAAIAVQLAAFLANLGYQATAHHFRHYDVICVPIAVDAGLGELGRNGYLITREFGPRVRLAVVTTNANLVPDKPVDLGVQHFCKYCKKCAASCPSRSIPTGEKTVVNGIRRWKLEAETCSAYWARVGTDCCICMAVCPWSHPRTLTHRLSTYFATRSAFARRVLIWLDDLFYGTYKRKWYGPEWCRYK